MEWRTISWLPDYAVSERGDVMRVVGRSHHPAGKTLKGSISPYGYRRFILRTASGPQNLGSHRLVCEAWHGPPPTDYHQTAHYDGVRTNNHYSNLRWATSRENALDRLRHGTVNSGAKNGQAKLTWDAVRQIRAEYRGRHGEAGALGQRYGVSKWRIYAIASGRSWKEPQEVAA